MFNESFEGAKAGEEAESSLCTGILGNPRFPAASVARGGGWWKLMRSTLAESEVKLRCHTANASAGMQSLDIFH